MTSAPSIEEINPFGNNNKKSLKMNKIKNGRTFEDQIINGNDMYFGAVLYKQYKNSS